MLVFRQLVCVVHGSMTDLLLLYSVGCRRRGWFVRVGKFFNGMKFCFEKKEYDFSSCAQQISFLGRRKLTTCCRLVITSGCSDVCKKSK